MANKKVIYGCLGATFVFFLALAISGYFIFKKGQEVLHEMEEGIKNPEEQALNLLGATQLPEGYYSQMAVRVPFISDFVLISDQPKDLEAAEAGNHSPDFAKKGMLYMKFNWAGEKQEEMKAYFEGKSDDASVLNDADINVNVEEVLDRGILEGSHPIYYVIYRGSFNSSGNNRDGVSAIFFPNCPTENKTRMGFRYGPEPEKVDGVYDFTNSIFSKEELTAFFNHFNFCL